MSDRKLVWFSSHLLDRYTENSRTPFGLSFSKSALDPKLAWHVAMHNIAEGVVCMIDHTGFSKNYGDGLNMDIVIDRAPAIHKTSWNLERGRLMDREFNTMIDARADAAYDQAERMGAEYIYISYSGGVDSVTMLAAFLQNPRARHWLSENRIILKTSRYAQREDPVVWQRIIDMGLPLEYLNYDDLFQDTRRFMLATGEVEPVWGSAYTPLARGYLPNEELFSADWRRLETYFLDKDKTGLAWEYFRDLQATAPFETKTAFQAWWWFEWCTNTQCYMFRLAAYNNNPLIDPDFTYPGNSRVYWMLANTDMWDHGAYVMANRLIPEDMSLLKIHSLRYAARWMGWAEPRPKPKVYSQFYLPKRVSKMRIWNDLTWDDGDLSDGV